MESPNFYPESLLLESSLRDNRAKIIDSVLTFGLLPGKTLFLDGTPHLPSFNGDTLLHVEGASANYLPTKDIEKSVSEALHSGICACLPVVCEREYEKGFPPDSISQIYDSDTVREILTERISASFLVSAGSIGINRRGHIYPDSFTSVMVPEKIAEEYGIDLLKDLYPIVKIISNYREKVIRFGSGQPNSFPLVVPDYQTEVENLIRQNKHGAWLHTVRLPTPRDILRAA